MAIATETMQCVGEGEPSRWLTLIGTRVLDWAGRA